MGTLVRCGNGKVGEVTYHIMGSAMELISQRMLSFVGYCCKHGRKIRIWRDIQNDAGGRGAENAPSKKYGHSGRPVIIRFALYHRRDCDHGMDTG